MKWDRLLSKHTLEKNGWSAPPRYLLIEPWWKQLRSLALKGRRFENHDELTDALTYALTYWNTHCHPYVWKKRPNPIGGLGVHRPNNILVA